MKINRRKYLVNPGYQLTQGGILIVSHLLVALLTGVLCSWFYLFIMDGGVACNHNREIIWYLGGVTLAVILATAYWAVRYSHSVAGMMIKVDQVMREAGRGNTPSRISFRKGDHFPWLSNSINDCLEQMKNCREQREALLEKVETVGQRLAEDELDVRRAALLVQQALTESKGSGDR